MNERQLVFAYRNIRRSPQRDPVTPFLRHAVLSRDRGCVPKQLGAPGECRNRWGHRPVGSNDFELDHVKDQPMLGKRAPSDPGHLITACHFHHQGGWATANRNALREYLRSVTAE